jgi:hypothetical protein
MPDATLLREANDLLYKELGGQSDSLPNYRIIWSTAVTEKRHGVFNDFYGKIFVRTYEGVREVIKYPYDQDRYVLERLEDARGNRELIEPYSYEPIYVFKDKRGFYLPLNMKVVQIYIDAIKHPPERGEIKARHLADLEAEERKEVEDFLAILHDTGRSPMFAYEDSVFLDSTKRKVN